MARFTVTTAASTQLRELLNSCGPEPHVVVIYQTGAQADVRRTSDGNTEWVRISDFQWCIGLDLRTRFEGKQLEVVEDIEFFVSDFPHYETIDGRVLHYTDGRFDVI